MKIQLRIRDYDPTHFKRQLGIAILSIATPIAVLAAPIWPDLIDPPTPWAAAVTPEGYLDVTKAPFNMDNDGGNAGPNTTALQNAIDFAYDYNLAVFFPAGTYDVNNKLELFQVEDQMTFNHCLVGSAAGARPLIRLQGSNFNNASNPKPLFHFYCSPSGNGPTIDTKDMAASGYNMVVRGIDIDLNGKAGAIAIDMHAAQGSTIQDVNIDATNAYAGIKSLCGSGTIHANIRIDGGKYGFYVSKNRPMPTLVGITCIGQTVRAIHFPSNVLGPITIVGFHIEAANGPVFDLNAADDDEHLALIDGSIEITGSSATVIKNINRSFYARNVYVKNGNKVVDNVSGAAIDVTDNSGNWTLLGDYNFCHYTNRQLIDGNFKSGEHKRDVIIGTASAPPADLISRHLWDESTFPHFEGAAIIVGPSANDTNTINNAIANAEAAGHNTVFLKKGHYYLDDSINLKMHTKLVGVSRHLTRIHADSGWTENNFTPMVTTPAAIDGGADATCMLAWLALDPATVIDESSKITWLDWTAGRHSMVREVHFKAYGGWNCAAFPAKRLKISGSGGGRWYSFWARAGQEQGQDTGHRQFYAIDTSEPLSFYALTVEYHESTTYMTEINNCSNISIYGFKCETDISSGDDSGVFNRTPALGIVESQNIIVMGQGGHAELDVGESSHALIEIVGESSDDIQVANASGGWQPTDGWGIVRDMYTNKVITKNGGVNGGQPVGLYSIGSPDPIVYSPTSSAPPPPSGVDSIAFSVDPPTAVEQGETVDIDVDWSSTGNYTVEVRLMDSGSPYLPQSDTITLNVGSGQSGTDTFQVTVNADADTQNLLKWRIRLLDGNTQVVNNVLFFNVDVSVPAPPVVDSIAFSVDPPTSVEQGETVDIDVDWSSAGDYTVEVLLMDSGSPYLPHSDTITLNVGSGQSGTNTFSVTVNADADTQNPLKWRIRLLDGNTQVVNNVLFLNVDVSVPVVDSIAFSVDPPTAVEQGETVDIDVDWSATGNCTVEVLLMDSGSPYLPHSDTITLNVGSGQSGTNTFPVTVNADADTQNPLKWRIRLLDGTTQVVNNVLFLNVDVSASAQNILTNGDFETGDMTGFTGNGTAINNGNSYSGYSGQLASNGGWLKMEQTQPVSPNTEYNVSGFIYATGITSGNAQFFVQWLDSSDNLIGGNNLVTGNITTYTVWTQFTNAFTSPSNAAKARLRVVSNGIPSGGYVRADNLVISTEAIPLLANGSAEAGDLSSWTGAGASSVITGANVHSGTYSFQLDCSGGWIHLEQYVPVTVGKTYDVSGCLELTGVTSGFSQIIVEFYNGSTSTGGWMSVSGNVSSNQGYTLHSGTTIAAPANSTTMRVRLISNNLNSGAKARFDEISVTEN